MSGWVITGFLATGFLGALVFLRVVATEIVRSEAEVESLDQRLYLDKLRRERSDKKEEEPIELERIGM